MSTFSCLMFTSFCLCSRKSDGYAVLFAVDRASGYVDENGTLRGTFEARLVKYMSDDCVIC